MMYIFIFILVFIGFQTLFKVLSNEPLTQKSIVEKGFKVKLIRFVTQWVKLKEKTAEKLQKRLYKAGLENKPEEFVAAGILKTCPLILLGILFLINGNLFLAIYSILLLVFFCYKHFNDLSKKIEWVNLRILEELPEVMSYLTNSLKTDKDITAIVENYKTAANQVLKNELLLLSADLKTGNIDEALYNFDMRLNITYLSNYISVVRATLDGETQFSNLEAITMDMEVYEYETAKRYADEIPSKVAKASFVVGGTMILFFLVIMVYSCIIGINQFN